MDENNQQPTNKGLFKRDNVAATAVAAKNVAKGQSRPEYVFDWNQWADRLLFFERSNGEPAEKAIVVRLLGIPFLDEPLSPMPRNPYDPRQLRIARIQNEKGKQLIASLPMDLKQSKLFSHLIKKGVFLTKRVKVGGRQKNVPIWAEAAWHRFVCADSYYTDEKSGEDKPIGKGWRGSELLLFQVIDRLDEDQSRTKLVVRKPFINEETGNLTWAEPGISSFVFKDRILDKLARNTTDHGTRYQDIESFDIIMAMHKEWEDSFWYMIDAADRCLDGAVEPGAEAFAHLAPFVKDDPLPEELDWIDLDPMFPVTPDNVIFGHIADVIAMMEDDFPGLYGELADLCEYDGEKPEASPAPKVSSAKSPKAEAPKKAAAGERLPNGVHVNATHLSKYIESIDGKKIVFTKLFEDEVIASNKRPLPCESCKAPIPVEFDTCPFCGESL